MKNASETVVTTVANQKGIAPSELSVPLSDVINPDALDKLLDGDS